MKLKIKKENLINSELKYSNAKSEWGLSAIYEDYKLVFSKSEQNTEQILNIYNLLSESAKEVWREAEKNAKKRSVHISQEDIFLALLNANSVKNLLQRLNASSNAAEIIIKNYLNLAPQINHQAVKPVPFEAFLLSTKLHNHKIGSLMLLGAILKTTPEDSILQAIFANIGLTLEKLELFAVWHLKLNYEFPPLSANSKYIYCCRQTEMLEEHFGYFFDLPAIELAVILSANKTLKDIEHQKALQILVKAANLAKNKQTKIIGENLVTEASK